MKRTPPWVFLLLGVVCMGQAGLQFALIGDRVGAMRVVLGIVNVTLAVATGWLYLKARDSNNE